MQLSVAQAAHAWGLARLALEFGRELSGARGNVTQPVGFAPNQLIKQGAKLVTSAEDVIRELPTPVRAAPPTSNATGGRSGESIDCGLTHSQ